MTEHFLPSDTSDALKGVIKSQQIDNFHLLLNKCALYDDKQEKFILYRKADRKKNISDYDVCLKFNKIPTDEIIKRYRETIQRLNLKTVENSFSVDWRLIVGLGNESVYKTSMTLHHIYGIPYIPGQAVKGVVRNWIISEKFKNSEEEALKDEGFRKIFGKEENQGKVIFFDAFPTEKIHLKTDIMNPHYGPYYSGEEPPADYHNPNPIFFLTVENTRFEFIVGIKEKDNQEIQSGTFKGKKMLDITSEWLKKALQEHGIGAKTAVGYGFFSLRPAKSVQMTGR